MESKKSLCPICLIQPIYDSKGHLLPGESIKCECCDKFVCGTCGYTDEDRRSLHEGGYMPEYIYNTFLTDDFVCHTCLINSEKDLIDEIPKEDLPCFINEKWYEKENQKYFNNRIKNLK